MRWIAVTVPSRGDGHPLQIVVFANADAQSHPRLTGL